MIFDLKTSNIIHATVTAKELRQDGHNIDWTHDNALFTTDGIELDKTYYFSCQVSPAYGGSAYPKTLDFSFTGYELNDKLRDYFEVLNESPLPRNSSNLMLDINFWSEEFFFVYATLKIMGNKMSVRKKLSKMHGANLVKRVARYIKGRSDKRFKHVMDSAVGAYLWCEAPKLTKNNAATVTLCQNRMQVADSLWSQRDLPENKAKMDELFEGDEAMMLKAFLLLSTQTEQHYLAPDDVKLAA